ncbi:phosphoribosyl-ATP diphosphatase [Candidatus Woesearchaeota archaeon]|jgi:phosphoribosylformimino-5-aminoimidazole carboxamide ribotide isomerase|nr:phosphoribosyl-ATP diphosphatase [Candidatus Woesearchaeota archaeon]|tara:strand:- start:1237 stop:2460 length:1224 start_codon:yes stop_codon:yes gene_type:complete
MIIPSIDLMDGKAVQLKQGKEKVLERENVLELALEFSKYGEIAVIDLDAALGKGNNIGLIKEICKIADCKVGGGIRTIEKANGILQAGAKKIIIGTKATIGFLKQLPKERVIVAIDTKGDYVVNKGWTQKTKDKPEQLIKKLESYCYGFLFTNVDKEGLMKGIDIDRIKQLRKLTNNNLTVAGGISSIGNIKKLENLGVDSQLGMALYTGKLNLTKAYMSLLDFNKNKGLIPTIVQDDKNQVLMLAYSSRKSLLETFRTGKACYYSRSRKKLWKKGETSGNYQAILNVKYDCDRDSLLFTVKQKNFACHSGRYSCFEDRKFSFEELFDAINDRISNPRKESYTSKIAADESKIKAKIREECSELLNYTNKDNLIWEISDLFYFISILMAKKGISLADIKNELWRRRK